VNGENVLSGSSWQSLARNVDAVGGCGCGRSICKVTSVTSAMMSKTHQAGAQRQCGASAVDLEMAGGHPGAAWCFSLILFLGVRISAHLYQSFAEAGHGSHPDGW